MIKRVWNAMSREREKKEERNAAQVRQLLSKKEWQINIYLDKAFRRGHSYIPAISLVAFI
jgi:hypothetical protein